MFLMDGVHYGGLLTKLRQMYYPTYQRKRRSYKRKGNVVVKRASSLAQGRAIDKQIAQYIETGKKPKNMLARGIVAYFEEQCECRLVCAQIPVYVERVNRITAGDLVVEDRLGRLIYIEVKSGYNRCARQGSLKGIPDAPNKDHSHWELQRQYTHQALVQQGLPIHASYVINAYQDGQQVTVKRRKVPQWSLNKFG